MSYQGIIDFYTKKPKNNEIAIEYTTLESYSQTLIKQENIDPSIKQDDNNI